MPQHASQMLSRNVLTFVQHLLTKEGQLNVDRADEITGAMIVTGRKVVVSEALLGGIVVFVLATYLGRVAHRARAAHAAHAAHVGGERRLRHHGGRRDARRRRRASAGSPRCSASSRSSSR